MQAADLRGQDPGEEGSTEVSSQGHHFPLEASVNYKAAVERLGSQWKAAKGQSRS